MDVCFWFYGSFSLDCSWLQLEVSVCILKFCSSDFLLLFCLVWQHTVPHFFDRVIPKDQGRVQMDLLERMHLYLILVLRYCHIIVIWFLLIYSMFETFRYVNLWTLWTGAACSPGFIHTRHELLKLSGSCLCPFVQHASMLHSSLSLPLPPSVQCHTLIRILMCPYMYLFHNYCV